VVTPVAPVPVTGIVVGVAVVVLVVVLVVVVVGVVVVEVVDVVVVEVVGVVVVEVVDLGIVVVVDVVVVVGVVVVEVVDVVVVVVVVDARVKSNFASRWRSLTPPLVFTKTCQSPTFAGGVMAVNSVSLTRTTSVQTASPTLGPCPCPKTTWAAEVKPEPVMVMCVPPVAGPFLGRMRSTTGRSPPPAAAAEG
jgi:hypothetical protein